MSYSHDHERSVSNIDTSAARSGIFTPGIARLELNAGKLDRFNQTLRRANPALPALGAEQIAGAARRVLRASAKQIDVPFIRVRMRRAAEIRAALVDAHWPVPAALQTIMSAIVDYMDDAENHLIAGDIPAIGQLDEAILVDAAMDALRAELDDYAEFCRFRHAEAARIGLSAPSLAIDREHWRRECEREALFEQQLRRVRESRFASNAAPRDPFRIR